MSTYLGKYADSGEGNVLTDDRLVKKSRGDNYGGYEGYSIGRTVPANQKRPTVQSKGNIQNGD
jgi:hypothetical protein